MKTLLYVVYGAEMFAHEATYSLLSAFAFLPPGTSDVRYLVYTDRPEHFGPLGVDVEPLTPARLDEWLGAERYHHRIKMSAHLDALRRLGGDVILVDTDTYFLQSPARLFARVGPGRALLHVAESRLSEVDEERYRILDALLKSGALVDDEDRPLPFADDEIMWNSGVIGVNAADMACIARAVTLVDQIKRDPRARDIHQVDQFATGYYLARATRLGGSDDVVFHYWYHDLKGAFRERLPALVGAGAPTWTPALAAARPRTSLLRKVKMRARIALRGLGLRVPGIRGSI